MDSRFLKFFFLFYAHNKDNKRHCGIYLYFTCIFGDIAELGFLCNKMFVCAEMPAKLIDDPCADCTESMHSFNKKGRHSPKMRKEI